MSEGWSVRVIPRNLSGHSPVEWYVVAVADKIEAVTAVRRALGVEDATVEAVQKLPMAFLRSRQLKAGEVAYLYSRGAARKRPCPE